MIDLLRATTRVSFSMVTTMISSIAKNKLLAIIIGPVGLGVYSQVQSVLTLLSTVLPVGSLGMVNSISSLHQKESYNQIASLLRFFFIRNIVLSLLVCLLIFVFSDFLSGILFRDLIINSVILSICIAVPLNVIFNFIEIYLKGIRRIELYVSFSILNSVFSLLITIPLVVFYGISGVLLAIPLTFIFGISVGVYIISKNNLVLKQSDKEEVSKDLIRNVYVMGLGGFLTMFMQHLSLLIILYL
ncbi:MAG: oligosaccharide flippase family protein [Ignavibacteria bacterium]|nr:oligosaccharide flippase family protein [Ignavibacteria bacterium]